MLNFDKLKKNSFGAYDFKIIPMAVIYEGMENVQFNVRCKTNVYM